MSCLSRNRIGRGSPKETHINSSLVLCPVPTVSPLTTLSPLQSNFPPSPSSPSCFPHCPIFNPFLPTNYAQTSTIDPSTSPYPQMTSLRQWWRRAASAIKDRRSLYLIRLTSSSSSRFRNPELEAAVIRATSHDDRSVDYKNAARVFAWARTSPSFLHPLMWALARRAVRTRSWPVALKSLVLTHGLLMRADSVPLDDRIGRLPFDLSDFKDRFSSPAKSWGFSAFVRAYFSFLDNRSVFATLDYNMEDEDERLDHVQKLQSLLDLLMQIRPYGNGMEVGLVLEAMDCVLIEIFEVYSQICNGIARFLLSIFGPGYNSTSSNSNFSNLPLEEKKRRGIVGMRVLRKAHQQSSQLSAYFELCRGLGVLNAAELPEVEKISEEDIKDLERLIVVAIQEEKEREMETPVEHEMETPIEQEMESPVEQEMVCPVEQEWVVFEDEQEEKLEGHFCKMGNDEGYFGNNNFVDKSWELRIGPNRGVPFESGNLIELVDLI